MLMLFNSTKRSFIEPPFDLPVSFANLLKGRRSFHRGHQRSVCSPTFLVAVFVVILNATIVPVVQAQCPPLQAPCRCAPSIYEPVSIICENAASLSDIIQAISQARNTPIDSLLILDSPVTTLPSNTFVDFTILRLVINGCNLGIIEDGAFNGPLIDSLVELDLTDNQLGIVPQTGLPRLRNLRKLYLNRNRISALQSDSFALYESRDILLKLELAGNRLTNDALGNQQAFRPLRSLQQLSLETNALTAIPSAAFVNQRQTLTNLNLGLNQINQVPVGALDFPNLSSLSLEFNGISEIIPPAFQGVPILQYLYLTGNNFPSWQPEMFRYIGQLRTLGIGETPISVIPANAFQYIPHLVRLEMSEAAVDTIERGAFQRTPHIQAIILNKNRLSLIDQLLKVPTKHASDHMQSVNALNRKLYAVNVGGNRIERVEPLAFANLPEISNLDISFNQLQTLPENTFMNSFIPHPNERRVMFVCGNPWLCDSALNWFRQMLRENVDIDINKPGCTAVCVQSINGCPPEGTPLRAVDFCANDTALPLTGSALSLVGWIILAIIMTILLISICLMALVKYGIAYRRRKLKDEGVLSDEQRMGSSTTSVYRVVTPSVVTRSRSYVAPTGMIDLDLPPAHTLDEYPATYLY
ncbi:unnamed protein product [Anisakis simplex]|uniref:LRRCT domain-containing protein n=1 Tax=Anisakis simplex TaxID=6269 RepID=A0A0M3K004_ANISI|nr:unnamed protein product [Anisakis simplex]